jgi:hypothetical protein
MTFLSRIGKHVQLLLAFTSHNARLRVFLSHRSKNLEEYISTLENNVKLKNDDIGTLESEIGILKSEKMQVASEMSAVNQVKIITFMADNNN